MSKTFLPRSQKATALAVDECGPTQGFRYSGMGRAGCRTTKSRRSQSESAKQSDATGLTAIILAGLPARRINPWRSTEAIRRYVDSHRPDLMEKFIRDDIEWGLQGND